MLFLLAKGIPVIGKEESVAGAAVGGVGGTAEELARAYIIEDDEGGERDCGALLEGGEGSGNEAPLTGRD
jgi:hypothetical protein